MATLTVRAPTKRDRLKLRNVRQRRVALTAPWDAHIAGGSRNQGEIRTLASMLMASDVIVAAVDDELCAFAVYERGDERYRWNLSWLGAGSPRVDATSEVAIELWVALLEECVRLAGRSGARRIFAYCQPDSVEQESLRQAGFVAFTEYHVLRGSFKPGLRESIPIRAQHESDLWSIHQLYNRTTPRAVQFAEAFTSDAWTTDADGRLPFRNRGRHGFVLPTEDGIGAACHIDPGGERPIVTLLCDDQLAHVMPAIVADALELAAITGTVDIVLPAYQLDRVNPFLNFGFDARERLVGTVRHTTATVVQQPVPAEIVRFGEARSTVPATYCGAVYLDRNSAPDTRWH